MLQNLLFAHRRRARHRCATHAVAGISSSKETDCIASYPLVQNVAISLTAAAAGMVMMRVPLRARAKVIIIAVVAAVLLTQTNGG